MINRFLSYKKKKKTRQIRRLSKLLSTRKGLNDFFVGLKFGKGGEKPLPSGSPTTTLEYVHTLSLSLSFFQVSMIDGEERERLN